LRIPLARPSLGETEVERVRAVLESGWVVQGPRVAEFERCLAELHGVGHAVAVSSGTAALHVLYLALGIGRGDAVFVPSFAWPSAANVAELCGARPVFVDVLPDTYNVDPASLERAVRAVAEEGTAVARCIVAVHEFGLACDLEALADVAARYGAEVVEDAACALGAEAGGRPVGAAGRGGILSFHPRKAVTTGEGGAVLTDDAGLADAARELRNHGQAAGARHAFPRAGLNYRMTDLQGALGTAQLERLPGILGERRRIAARYLRRLDGLAGMRLPAASPAHTWQTFMVVLDADTRDDVVRHLAARRIGSGAGSLAAHCLDVYASRYGLRPDGLPVSRELHERGLALPLFAGLADAEVDEVCDALAEALAG
jgi:dTDP-4-amino-4,6-dideoxygalactose transaminase